MSLPGTNNSQTCLIFLVVSLAEQTVLSLTLPETRKQVFSRRCPLAAMSCALFVGILTPFC